MVVANPPYMGRKGFNETLRTFVDKNYAAGAQDLYGCFMLLNHCLSKRGGMFAMITIPNWMFLSRFDDLRAILIEQTTIDSLIHLGRGMFGSDFGTCAFVIRNFNSSAYRGRYERLFDKHVRVAQPEVIAERFFAKEKVYFAAFTDFSQILGSPFAYWVNRRIFDLFRDNPPITNIATSSNGIQTGHNDRFVRYWHEVNDYVTSVKWVPYNKGGAYRKWYGNYAFIVDWENRGEKIKSRSNSCIRGEEHYLSEGITWSDVTSGSLSCRFLPPGFLFDAAGPSAFFDNERHLLLTLSFINTHLIEQLSIVLNPTLHFQSGDFRKLPSPAAHEDEGATQITRSCIEIARSDWDSLEVSRDFQAHPLLSSGCKRLADAFKNWRQRSEAAFRDLQRLEEENNRYWIKAFELEAEFSAEVTDEQITLRHADLSRDVRSLISYAVGCMLGRYSLDEPGLIHAGQTFDSSRHVTFPADHDAILPITDDAYFEDDAVSRFVEFLRVAFSPEHLTKNLDYVADALTRKKNETAVGRIRRYFLDEFAKDHIQTYSKRPIYWLFTSGKDKGFNALVYLHRYDEGTLPRLRTEYLHELQPKLEAELVGARDSLERASTGTARKAAEKRVKALAAQLAEIRDYDEKLRHAADQRIRLDLDDGVTYNYTLFEGLLYEGSDLKMADLKKRSKWKSELLAKSATAEATG